jgi:hypothetical protein
MKRKEDYRQAESHNNSSISRAKPSRTKKPYREKIEHESRDTYGSRTEKQEA